MKPLKHLILIAILCLTAIGTQAQINFKANYLQSFPSTMDSGTVSTALLTLRNVDTGTFVGSISYNAFLNGNPVFPDFFNGLYFDTLTTVFLAPGDSLVDTLRFTAIDPQFLNSPSVVVIWPITVSGNYQIAIMDTPQVTIEVQPVVKTAIGEIIEGALYYNNGRIMLREGSKNELMQVRIYNSSGAEIYDTDALHAKYIELPDLPAGMYIAEAVLSNNKRAILKFIKPLH